MELFHGGRKIEKINDDGVFGSFLFFSAYENTGHGSITYKIEIEESDIVKATSMYYDDDQEKCNDIISELVEMIGCDEEKAWEILTEKETLMGFYQENDREGEWDYEVDFEIQHMTARCARRLGYRGVLITDEHGGSYMIDMLGRENELVIVKEY